VKEKKQPVISVIMSVYNQKNFRYLNDAVMSILRQTFSDFEFIIYNDGSDDEILKQLQKYTESDSRILLINNPVNQGLAYSLNACIDVARGKYLARMDDDDICDVRRLQVQYDYLEKHQAAAFIGCNAALTDDDGVWGHRCMPEKPNRKDFLKFSPYIHPTVMIRRSVLEQGNTYNTSRETLRCEDYELFMRLEEAGYRGYNIQQELFCYREDYNSYQKRKLKYRLAEIQIRYQNFKKLKMLTPLGMLYALRPLASAMVPSGLILYAKKYHSRQEMKNEEQNEKKIITISENTEKRAGII